MLRGRPFKRGDRSPNPVGKGNTLAVKHSLHVYRRMLSGGRLDARTSLYKVLREKEQELITALGGDPSPQERLIIADAMLYIGTVDEYLMALDGSIIRGGKAVPVIETRTSLASHLRRNLEPLGLSRRVKQQSWEEILSAESENGNGDDTATNGKAD